MDIVRSKNTLNHIDRSNLFSLLNILAYIQIFIHRKDQNVIASFFRHENKKDAYIELKFLYEKTSYFLEDLLRM